MSEWVRTALEQLTIDEKLTLLAGRDSWHTISNDRVGIPTLKVTDGPRGARGADGNHGPTSTSFPSGSAMGATWNPELIEQVGAALAHQTRAKGAHVLLGPTVNIPRIPNAGRNFECFSEDPLLSGTLAAAWVRGLQSEGVAACIKHFVCNDQEHDRYNVDAIVDERALREIYLEPFRIAIEESAPWAVMSAYNTINGTTASEHPLLTEVLRDELGFDGAVISDWYGTYSGAVAASGLDLEMPGSARWLSAEEVTAAIDRGDASWDDVDRKVEHLLTLMERSGARDRTDLTERAEDTPERRALARRVAAETITLLTNDGALPLERTPRIAVVGELAAETPHQGGGSSSVNPHRVMSILDGIRAASNGEVTWSHGTRIRKGPPPLPAEALGDGLLVEYFRGTDLDGQPTRSVRTHRSFINLFGEEDGPLDLHACSIRVSGSFTPRTSGVHRFRFAAEGGLRVWVDGAPVVDEWVTNAAEGSDVELDLTAGTAIDLRIEYASQAGLRWRFIGFGCVEPGPEPSIEEAARTAAGADVAVVVAGLTLEYETEGLDRPDLVLPAGQDDLIAAVAAVQPNTIVVLVGGSPVLMPWREDVRAIVHAWYGGQEIGHALADVLFGDADPGGRLPVTFPATSRQHPGLLNHPGHDQKVRYGEGVYVGYKGFDRLGLTPLFEFGHGLSYTSFEARATEDPWDEVARALRVEVTNTGSRRGTDVLRVFARDIGGLDRSLIGFTKVRLDPGERAIVSIPVVEDRLRTWSNGGWSPVTGPVTCAVEGLFEAISVTIPANR
ncbi:MAG: beta-glucosidase [Acidimicrobiia bacterium]|nr:beta-glucosidase [Acidimicrobiia bacterium]